MEFEFLAYMSKEMLKISLSGTCFKKIMRIVDIDNGSLQHQPYCNDHCNIIYVLNFSQRKKVYVVP